MWNVSEVVTPSEWFGANTTTTLGVTPPSYAAALYIVLVILGLVGNPIIIIVPCMKTFRTPGNVFIINLAVADTGVMLTCVLTIESVATLSGQRVYGFTGCAVHAFSIFITSAVSLLTMGFVALTRYICIVHPWRRHWFLRWRWCVFTAVLTWVYAILLILPILVGVGQLAFLHKQHHCSFDWSYSWIYNLILFLATYCLTTVTIFFCYINIYRTSRRRIHGNLIQHQSELRKGGEVSCMATEYRLALQLIVVYLLYNIFWLPYLVITLFIDPDGEYSVEVYTVLKIMNNLNSVVNIAIYLIINRGFQDECGKLLGPFKMT